MKLDENIAAIVSGGASALARLLLASKGQRGKDGQLTRTKMQAAKSPLIQQHLL